jgi:starch phosphorylase
MIMADFESYVRCQQAVARAYADRGQWARKSILNTANMGPFSSDRTIRQYADEIWKIQPVDVELGR